MKHKVRPFDEINKKLDDIFLNEESSLITELLTTAAERIIQEALENEVSDFLGRRWYEHNPNEEFRGYRNGYQSKRIKSSEGILNIRKPRVRENTEPFESRIMERLDAIDDKLSKIIMESYVRGLSTRDIENTFTDSEGKPLLSRSGVSAMTKNLYKEYEEFASRDLSDFDIVYLFIDGVYEAVKNYTRNQAILCAWAICSDGSKRLIHLMAAESESSQCWNTFFDDMLNRGLRQPLLIVSDGSKGIIKAITEKFPLAERQRCIAHKMRNIMSKVPLDVQPEIKNKLRAVYYAPDKESAETLAAKFINEYADKYPSMVKCFTDDLQACLTHLTYPEGHRKHIRTTNTIERAFVEEKRRTKIIPQHAHEKGAIGLVFSVLIRASNSWRKVTMSDLDLAQLKNMKKIICPDNNDNNFISYYLAA